MTKIIRDKGCVKMSSNAHKTMSFCTKNNVTEIEIGPSNSKGKFKWLVGYSQSKIENKKKLLYLVCARYYIAHVGRGPSDVSSNSKTPISLQERFFLPFLFRGGKATVTASTSSQS